MISSWSRRAALALACAGAAALLAACGSGSVVSDLKPKRFLTVGDGFTDVGQAGYRYTVNDGTHIWVQELASHYGLEVTPASAGGFGYAQGGARVVAADTSGANAPSVAAQIDAMLARTTLHPTEDVVVIGGGIADIVAAVEATGISAATTEAVRAAGKALGEQVKRVVTAGARHVLVVGVYNLGNTPWAGRLDQRSAIDALSVEFTSALKVEIVDMGDTVLAVDPALLHNLMYNKPENYYLDNGRDPVCTTPDATTCTTATLVPGADYERWMYADSLYLTPRVSRRFGSDDYAESIYYIFKNRW